MLTGYNTDIKHEGVIYHVQTEDGGTENPVIVSLIYKGGRILASKKTSYAHLLGTEGMMARLRELLEHQHKTMIKAILTGTLAAAAGKAAPAPAAEPAPQARTPVSPAPAAAATKGVGTTPQADKPPLEMPPESAAEAPADSGAEKNLDQVILEYLASEIDKD